MGSAAAAAVGSGTMGTSTTNDPGGSSAQPEQCDGKDNDRDGVIDEGLSRACGAPMVGDCRPGLETCSMGVWSICVGAVGPMPEACDAQGHDENCDGSANEMCACQAGQTQPCGSGACVGTQACEGGHWSMTCSGASKMKPEVCDAAAVDEDCDGMANEDCMCVDGATEACPGNSRGECKPGTHTCVGGKWSACQQVVAATAERCDGADNDCDGVVDNGATCTGGMQCNAGRCVQCVTSSDCSKMNTDCVQASCDATGSCRANPVAEGVRCRTGVCHAGGCVACVVDADCPSNARTCVSNRCVAECGNGIRESGEVCDGLDGLTSCTLLGYDGGSVSCTRGCLIDLSQCYRNDPPPSGGSGG